MRIIQEYPHCGKHCYIKEYKDSKVIKIFNVKAIKGKEDLETFLWGDIKYDDLVTYIPLWQACIVQNILYHHGISPRVFELVIVRHAGKRYFTQIVEDAGRVHCDKHEDAYDTYNKAQTIGERYHFKVGKQDVSKYDVLITKDGKKLIDFNSFYFHKKDWKERIEQEYKEKDPKLMELIRPFYLENLLQ